VSHFTNQLRSYFSNFQKGATRRTRTLREWLREDGLQGVVRKLARFVQDFRRVRRTSAAFDRSLGVETARPVGLWHLRIPSENVADAERYQAVDPSALRRLLSGIQTDWSSFTFIDLGCGKGRALIVANEFGFQRLIGVEFAAKLARTATRNCQRLGLRAEILSQDAAEFLFPPEKLAVYLNNPFGPRVLNRVLDHLLERNTRHSYVLYVYPIHRHCLDGRPGFEPMIANRYWAVWKLAPRPKRPLPLLEWHAARHPETST
jgi:predicted RNA methylase